MNDQIVASAVISFFVALIVTLITHALTSSRDIAKQQREQRVAYLVGAFRSLSKANHHPRLYEVADEVEQAISDIQLLGTPSQIALAKQFAHDMGTTNTASLDPLLLSLRTSLRRELSELQVDGNLVWLRIARPDLDHKG